MNNLTEMKPLDFGDYCTIEQKRFGSDNEHYVHKVIKRFESNMWVSVPVVYNPVEKHHTEMAEVVSCICCGVSETEVFRYRVVDVKFYKTLPK